MMSPSFAFIPRNVSKNAKQQESVARVFSSPSFKFESTESSYPEPGPPVGKGKAPDHLFSAKPVYDEKDISFLIVLALSDYALWIDSDLRRKTEESLQREEHDAGFLPLSYLMRRTLSRENLAHEHMPAEAGVVKAIRAYVGDVLEVRMLVSSPSTSAWYPSWRPERDSVGGYEVRRKDWSMLSDNATRDFTRAQWDDRTVYMENIPPQYHTIPDIIRFTQGLLSRCTDEPFFIPIQNITLSPHHLDKPGDRPKCKGFALVTFCATECCHVFLERWHWKPSFRLSKINDLKLAEDSLEEKEALKFGFRTLPKVRWDELNQEYIAYRERLIEELADAYEPPDIRTIDVRSTTGAVLEDNIPLPPKTVTNVFSSYPFGCLVFARNLHSETNKTTLRTLFTTALKSSPLDPGGLDYIDFNKGMDSCYLRLASPEHTRTLVDYFSNQPVVQSHGLDDIGKNPGASEKAITTEIIEGKKEEVYWEKVPEKIRRQAVDKVVTLGNSQPSASTLSTQEHSEGRSRKKRKRGQ